MSLISEYFARVGADVDEKSLKEVDKFLSQIEKKLNKLNNNVKIADTVKKSISQTAQEIKGVKTVKAKADALTKEATAQKALNKQKAEEAKQVAKVAKATKELAAVEKSRIREDRRNNRLKPIGGLDRRIGHLFPDKGMSATARNRLAKEYESTFGLPYARVPKSLLESRLSHLQPNIKPTTKAAYKRRQEELQGVFGSLVKSSPTIHQRKDVSASQASRNRAAFFATEAAVIKGIKDGDREGFIKRETEARKNQIKTTKQLIKAEQRLTDIQKRKEMSSEIKRRVASRVAAHEAESSGMRAVLARQEAQMKALNERYKELMSAKPKRGGVGSFATGLGAGSVLRSGLPALPMIGGAFGFVSANKFSQEVALAPMTTMAAFEAQGRTSAEAQQSWEWYKQLSQKVGANYMDSAQDFNSFMANALGSGINIEDSQNIFKGFSEYQTAMGLTPYRRKLVNAALTQMLGKGTVSTEELNNRFL